MNLTTYLAEISKVLSASDETPIRITREPLPKSGTGKILKKEIRKQYPGENA